MGVSRIGLRYISMPNITVFVGPNGSGKSSIISQLVNIEESNYICPDNFYLKVEGATEEERYVLAINEAERVRYQLLSKGEDFIFETVGSKEDKLEFLEHAKRLGYTIICVFVTTKSHLINIQRIKDRVAQGGLDVPDKKVRDRYYRAMELLHRYLLIADSNIIVDNSDEPTAIGFYSDNLGFVITKRSEFDWLIGYVYAVFGTIRKVEQNLLYELIAASFSGIECGSGE